MYVNLKKKNNNNKRKNEKVNAKCLGENLISVYLMYLRQATFNQLKN